MNQVVSFPPETGVSKEQFRGPLLEQSRKMKSRTLKAEH